MYLRYERVSDNPMEELAYEQEVEEDNPASDGDVIAFPLRQEEHEVELENLSEGWYLICGEAVRSQVVLEKDCIRARIFKYQDKTGKQFFAKIQTNIM